MKNAFHGYATQVEPRQDPSQGGMVTMVVEHPGLDTVSVSAAHQLQQAQDYRNLDPFCRSVLLASCQCPLTKS